MKASRERPAGPVEVTATVRKRNQITLPKRAVDLLGIREGDVVIICVKRGSATIRPVRRSYAGIGKGIYGNRYVAEERADWD